MLYNVHTCIAIFFHSNNPVFTHSINQNIILQNMFHQNPYTVETLWLTFLEAQKNFHTISDFTKCCCIIMISHVSSRSSRPNWYSTHAVCNKRIFFLLLSFKNCYYFSDLETQWPRNPELKSSSSQFTGNFMAPMGPLKIKTGLPTSPICQRALITHDQIPAFVPDWSISAKLCQIVIIVYWHNCLRPNFKHYRKDDW